MLRRRQAATSERQRTLLWVGGILVGGLTTSGQPANRLTPIAH